MPILDQDQQIQDDGAPGLAVKDDGAPGLAVKDDGVPVLAVKDDGAPGLAVKNMHVIIVQDVSGSMEDQRKSVATGINEIIGDLKRRYSEPCEYTATFRMISFSSHDLIQVGDAVPVHDVKPIDPNDLVFDGMTALWDAAAIAINLMNEHSAGVPATTYIFTDGDNNDSMHHRRSGVNEMIAENKKKNPAHSILFIGSDPSTRHNANGMGLDRVHSIQHDSENTPLAYHVCSRALGRCISGDTQSTEFTQDDIVLSETPSAPRGYASLPRGYASLPRGYASLPRGYASPPLGNGNDSQMSDDYAFASDELESDGVPSMPQRAWS
jgi:uncharacterized protein YegL